MLTYRRARSRRAFESSSFRQPGVRKSQASAHASRIPTLVRKIDFPARSRSNLHRWPSPDVRGTTESKVRLAPFCLAERQASSVCRAPLLFLLFHLRHLPRAEKSAAACAFVAIAPLRRHALRHAPKFRAIPVHPGLGPTDISAADALRRAIDR